MNLKFLRSLNEDHEKYMSSEEMKTYLELLYKKCSKSNKAKFDDYLKKECDVEDVDLTKCADIICKDKKQCDKVIHYLEDLSEKLDENSLAFHLNEKGESNMMSGTSNMRYAKYLKVAAENVWNVWQGYKHGYDRLDTETLEKLKEIWDYLDLTAEKLKRR